MALYAKVMDGTIREDRDFAAAPPDMSRKGFKWLPYVDTDPPFDPATQLRTGPVVAVRVNDVTRVWTVRAKTAPELDTEKDGEINTIRFLQFEVAFDMENRVRVLEGKAVITKSQYRNALKARLP